MITVFSFFTFLFLNFIFIVIWNKNFKKTPSGVGIFLLIPFVFYCLNQKMNLPASTGLVLCSLFYFLDDLIEINFKIRIGLQILASLIIFYLFREKLHFNYIILIVFLFFVLINSLNFQDGQDLNIFIILFLIFLSFYFFSNQKITKDTSMLILTYLISFGFFNRKPNKLFFGDSGCYVATLILFIFSIDELRNLLLMKSIIGILLFPLTDIMFVIMYRVYKKENILTRNYYHIYQILYKKTRYYIYLLPNIFFGGANFYLLEYLQLDFVNIIFIISFNICSCLIFKILIKK
jgi:UDP-GlcNAc:undecaprenyl-phosphate GlcNAc-1-phosphate transferase